MSDQKINPSMSDEEFKECTLKIADFFYSQLPDIETMSEEDRASKALFPFELWMGMMSVPMHILTDMTEDSASYRNALAGVASAMSEELQTFAVAVAEFDSQGNPDKPKYRKDFH